MESDDHASWVRAFTPSGDEPADGRAVLQIQAEEQNRAKLLGALANAREQAGGGEVGRAIETALRDYEA